MHLISCFFLFSFFAHKMMEKHIFTSIWTMQHPNSFQNIQQLVPGGDWLRWLNWTVKVTVKWIDQRSLDFRFLCVLKIYCVLNNNTFKLFSREHILRLIIDLNVGLPIIMGSFKLRALLGSDRCFCTVFKLCENNPFLKPFEKTKVLFHKSWNRL